MQLALIRKSVFLIFFICSAVHAQCQAPPLPPPVDADPNAPVWKEPTPPSQTEWTIWKDEHFQISYPPKWYALPTEVPNSPVGFFSLIEPNDYFKEIVMVYKTTVNFRGTTAELGQEMEKLVKGLQPDAELVSSQLVTINTLEAAELTFRGSVGGDSKSRLIVFHTENEVYVVDMLYEFSNAEKYENLFSEMVKTIRVF